MSATLEISLLGRVEIRRHGLPVNGFVSAKAQVDTLKEEHGGTESAKRAERLYAEKYQQQS